MNHSTTPPRKKEPAPYRRVDLCIFCRKYGGTLRVARNAEDGKKLGAYYHQECLEKEGK